MDSRGDFILLGCCLALILTVSAITEFPRTSGNSEWWLHLTNNEINLNKNNIAPPSSHPDIQEVNPADIQQIHELWTELQQGPGISVIESQMGYPLVHQGIQTFDGGSQMGQITSYNPIDNPEAWESFQNIITSSTNHNQFASNSHGQHVESDNFDSSCPRNVEQLFSQGKQVAQFLPRYSTSETVHPEALQNSEKLVHPESFQNSENFLFPPSQTGVGYSEQFPSYSTLPMSDWKELGNKSVEMRDDRAFPINNISLNDIPQAFANPISNAPSSPEKA
ncbi:uncharacterized protein PGTG_18604 [Puccinia graminis f. sp. tritici CRL 75-36-700-3]|uniref:Uncharacterized protein n=1 Tax=Puccinia graminis f. sp. tritici (strain CRL 75-36-700-3 / race SCCL) TaxID=418459 RepID=E3L7T0_PUCGT|nr:uncharacterized protein PGTG_18604 [Puccinia graminis f. sp. tritici CRL 75-36-700-3]EFP92605.1 hypothetical protein PGTG_18604 [Puccinia graminis f. sp. tritici CRL 75-36-700-3]